MSVRSATSCVGDGAELTWLIVQDQPDTATYFGQFNAWIGKDAKLVLFVMNAGGRLVRQEINVVTKGEGSTFTLRGINLLAGDTHTDVTMVLDHAVPQTSSTEVIRNVVTGRARRLPGPHQRPPVCAEDRRQDGLQHVAALG